MTGTANVTHVPRATRATRDTHPVQVLREALRDHDPAHAQPRPREHRVDGEVDDEGEARGPGAHHGLGQRQHPHPRHLSRYVRRCKLRGTE